MGRMRRILYSSVGTASGALYMALGFPVWTQALDRGISSSSAPPLFPAKFLLYLITERTSVEMDCTPHRRCICPCSTALSFGFPLVLLDCRVCGIAVLVGPHITFLKSLTQTYNFNQIFSNFDCAIYSPIIALLFKEIVVCWHLEGPRETKWDKNTRCLNLCVEGNTSGTIFPSMHVILH